MRSFFFLNYFSPFLLLHLLYGGKRLVLNIGWGKASMTVRACFLFGFFDPPWEWVGRRVALALGNGKERNGMGIYH